MNREELIAKMAEKTGYSKANARNVLTAFEDTVLKEVKAGGSVDLMKLASFSSKVRPARTGRNPITGEPVEIPEKRVPDIKAHKPLKDACNL